MVYLVVKLRNGWWGKVDRSRKEFQDVFLARKMIEREAPNYLIACACVWLIIVIGVCEWHDWNESFTLSGGKWNNNYVCIYRYVCMHSSTRPDEGRTLWTRPAIEKQRHEHYSGEGGEERPLSDFGSELRKEGSWRSRETSRLLTRTVDGGGNKNT